MTTVDLNADMGESFGPWKMGDDTALLRVVTSANIACGGHAGDADVMATTMRNRLSLMVIESCGTVAARLCGTARERMGAGERRPPGR